MMTDQTPREHQAENSEPSLSQSELEEKSERLHIHDHDRKDFTSFCQRAGLPTAFRYLNLLDEVFKILDVARNARLGLKQDKLMQLALMRRYPQLYDSEKINTAAKIRALESPLVVGETISRNIIEPPILALDVVQKGFNSEYVGHDEIVTPGSRSVDISLEPRYLLCALHVYSWPDSTGEPPRSQLATEMLDTNSSKHHYNALIAAMLHVASDFFKKKARKKSDRAELLKEWNEHQESIHSDFYSNVRSKLGELVDTKDSPHDLRQAVWFIHDSNFFKYTQLKVVLAIDEASALLEFSPIGEFRGSGSFALKDAMAFKTVDTLAIAVDEMARVALKKLLFCDDTTKPVEITEARALALLGPTIGVPLHGQARLNVGLTASHAAHCGYIDPAQELQYSFYPSQPIYALTANDYLYQNEDELVLCIDSLARVLSRGCVDTGEAGEYASRIILLCAMNKTVHDLKTLDKARDGTDNKAPDGMDIDSPPDDMKTLDKAPKTSNKAPNIPDSRPVELKEFPGAIPVARFLETLTGISANTLPLGSIASEQKKRLLEEGMMHWNHFIQCTKTPTTESLMEGLHRGVAMQCQHSQKAFDQVLTIYLKERSRDFLEPKNISFCGVQVKNVPHDTAAQIHIPVVDDP
ncbi:hypothetical protein PtB15_8B734 [Puccinia triticina]|nr:hypothetical protein PtB15_8B734 [Puccinia triticina]